MDERIQKIIDLAKEAVESFQQANNDLEQAVLKLNQAMNLFNEIAVNFPDFKTQEQLAADCILENSYKN